MSTTFPFPVQQELTQIALAYRNQSFIADMVMPRTPVPFREFKWLQFTREDLFNVPNTIVGRKGVPAEVEFGATEVASFVRDYGLDDLVPQEDLLSAPGSYNPLGRAVEGITELIALDREVRVANLLTTAGTYAAGNSATLSGTSQWSDYTNADPYTAIMSALEGLLVRPNTMVIGRQAWNRLRVHPRITAAVYPNGGQMANTNRVGTPASVQAVADLLELSNIYVGDSWRNTAAKGQTASMARVWGKHAAFLHLNPVAGIRGEAITFGYTAQFGTRVAGSIPEPNVGLRGAQRVRVGESVREVVCANDVGYLFLNAVA